MICFKHKWGEWTDVESDIIVRLPMEGYGYKRLGTKTERCRTCTRCGKVEVDETASVWRDNERFTYSPKGNPKR